MALKSGSFATFLIVCRMSLLVSFYMVSIAVCIPAFLRSGGLICSLSDSPLRICDGVLIIRSHSFGPPFERIGQYACMEKTHHELVAGEGHKDSSGLNR